MVKLSNFPFTITFALLGLLVGVIFSNLSSIPVYDFADIVGENFINSFIDYLKEFFDVVIDDMLVGSISSILFGLIGLVIDFSRLHPEV